MNHLKERLESTNKFLNNEKDLNELDNTKIIEKINKNIEVLTRGITNSNQEIEQIEDPIKTEQIDNSFYDSNTQPLDFKNVDYYIKKKISKDFSNSPQNISLKISPKK
jgi:hypothetical protein